MVHDFCDEVMLTMWTRHDFSDEVMLTMTRHSVLLFFSERIINFPESPLLDLPPLQIITRKHRTEPKPSREDVSRTTMASS